MYSYSSNGIYSLKDDKQSSDSLFDYVTAIFRLQMLIKHHNTKL